MDATELRIGDKDRHHIAEVLRSAHEEGRLTEAELDERTSQLPSLRTFGELDRLVSDLPIPAPSSVLVPTLADGQVDPERPLRLDGGMSSDGRTGVWTLPRRIELSGGMGTVRLDCLEALCPHERVDVTVSGGAGSLIVIVPEGWAGDIQAVQKSWGSAKSTIPTVPDPGCPVLVFEGNMAMGSLRVRHANWFDRRRQLHRLRKQRKLELTTGWTQSNPEIENPSTLR